MASKRGGARGRGRGKAPARRSEVPDVYQEMLAEALPVQSEVPERPLKRRRTGRPDTSTAPSKHKTPEPEIGDDEEELEFEDVLEPESGSKVDVQSHVSLKPQQTAYRDSDEESGESTDDEFQPDPVDFDWDNIDFNAKPEEEETGDLVINLSRPAPQQKHITPRRKAVSKDEKAVRLEIHKLHLLCLLCYLNKINRWCNDPEVQKNLKVLLDKKTIKFLLPKSDLSQFGQTESFKRGLEDAAQTWRSKFLITKRGMRRSLWADDEKDLENYEPPGDVDSIFSREDFRGAAKILKGSRDLGAQLFCAMLRSAGVDTRLVCSLQPLSFTAGGPSMPKPLPPKKQTPKKTQEQNPVDVQSFASGSGSSDLPVPPVRSRLGHPNAAAYHMPDMKTPSVRIPPKPKPKPIIESPFPVFWVEVFDHAHQKWLPVDPLVTGSIAKPRQFEPPSSDRENNMSYVIALEEEGFARDVTLRYTKAFVAKTRKTRVESTPKGERWWRRAMKPFNRGYTTDADQIEDVELNKARANEPMPKNILDFKDHPVYALERHLRRNEVLTSDQWIGTVAAGRDASTPGGKKMEKVYRRKDVKVARSEDAWYRLGREVKSDQIMFPVRITDLRKRGKDEDMDGAPEKGPVSLYTEDQTILYEAPPVVNGHVPKNSFGNIDIYLPSMVPKGGVHITDVQSLYAAKLIGIDFAPALTGFKFQGPKGTPVFKGIVIAAEYKEAIEAVIEGIRDEQGRMEDQRRAAKALKMWKIFLTGMRIKKRIDSYAVEGEDNGDLDNETLEKMDEDSDDSDAYVDDEEEGGGFIPE